MHISEILYSVYFQNIIHVYHWLFQIVFLQLRNQNTALKIPSREQSKENVCII